MRGALSLLVLFFSGSILAQTNSVSERAIVLVPGTLNSATPDSIDSIPQSPESLPYFSHTIVETLRARTPHVYVVKHLRIVGDLKWNGEQVLRETRAWYENEFPQGNVPITFIAHSAGAFYSLWASHLNNLEPSSQKPLPIRDIIMLSAPLEGAELADFLFFNPTLNQQIERALSRLGPQFDFRGILQLTTARVEQFLSELTLPRDIKLYSVAFEQTAPSWGDHPLDSSFLSPLLATTDWLIERASDGIVSVKSAEAASLTLKDKVQNPIVIQPVHEVPRHLDHLEQVLDISLFAPLGFLKLETIRKEQIELYNALYDLP
jgi:hypothetical protein